MTTNPREIAKDLRRVIAEAEHELLSDDWFTPLPPARRRELEERVEKAYARLDRLDF